MNSLFMSVAILWTAFSAAARDIPVNVPVSPGASGVAGGVTGVSNPGAGPGIAGPQLPLQSVLPKVDMIGPILSPAPGALAGSAAAGSARAVPGGIAGHAVAPAVGAAAAAQPGVGGAIQTGAPLEAPVGQAGAGAVAVGFSIPGGGPDGGPAAGGPRALDSRRQAGGGGASPVRSLDVTVQAIEGAKQAERKGDAAALGSALHTFYEGDVSRRAAGPGLGDAAAARGLTGLPPSEQVSKLTALAETAGPADAPSLYRDAAERASRSLDAAEASRAIGRLNQSAAHRAPEALRGIAVEGVRQAHAGALGGKALAKVGDAIDFWNAQAYLSGQPSLSNAAELKAAIARLQAAASKPSGRFGKTAPKVRFVPDTREEAAGRRLRAVLRGDDTAPSAVAQVPAVLAESFAIPELSRAKLELPGADVILSAFELEAPAGAGAKAVFRAHRARGESAAGSLWAAARLWLAAAARSWWRLVVRLVRSVLQTFGVVDEPPRLVPGVRVTPAPDFFSNASAEPLRLRVDGAKELNGYRIGPAWTAAREAELRVTRAGSGSAVLAARLAAREGIEAHRRETLRLLAGAGALGEAEAKAMLEHARRALDLFDKLAADRPARRLARSARAWLEEAERGVAREGGAARALDGAARLDKPTASRLLEALSQAAAEQAPLEPKSAEANLSLAIGGRAVPAVDLSQSPSIVDGRIASPALRALVAAARSELPGSFVVRDRMLWASLGPRGRAELLADLSAPEAGGLVRARLQTGGAAGADEAALYLAARVFYDLGFSVQVHDGLLSAVVDREHNAAAPDELEERVPVALAALSAAARMDALMPALLEGGASREEMGRRLAEWATTIEAEGTLPFSDEAGAREYRRGEPLREALRPGINRTLREAGLRELAATEPIGQRTLELRLNRPIEAGLARGELRADAGGRVTRSGSYDPAARVVDEAAGSPKAAAELADVLASFGAGAFRYETLGLAGGLKLQRAQRRLEPGVWLDVYSLADPATGRPLFARAERASPEGTQPLDTGRLLALLPDEPATVAGPALSARLARLRASPMADAGGFPAVSLAAAEKPVVARVTYDKAKAAQGGVLFASPYTTPEESAAVSAARGLLLTSGFGSSHGAAAARSGVPAFVLPGAEWTDAGLRLEGLRFGPARAGPRGVKVARVEARSAAILREGAVVKLDGARGRVAPVARDQEEIALRAAEALIAYGRSGAVGSLTSWIAAQLSSGGLTELEKAALAQEILEGVAGSKDAPAARAALREHLGPGAAATLAAIEARLR